MPPRATLTHQTTYHYERPVRLGPQWLRLRPRPDPRAQPPGFCLRIDPAPTGLYWQSDAWGNHIARLVFPDPLDRLDILATLTLDRSPRNPFAFVLDPPAARWPFPYDPQDAEALAPFLRPDHPGPLLQAFQAGAPAQEPVQETVALLLALAAQVRDRVIYVVRMEPGVWPPDLTLREGRGSCRDSAWLLVQLLRLRGIAARFVSGYLIQQPEDGGPPNAELHAWAEAFLPGAGWIGADATSGLLAAEGHVALAAAPGPLAAAPLSGTVEPAGVRLETSVTVEPLP